MTCQSYLIFGDAIEHSVRLWMTGLYAQAGNAVYSYRFAQVGHSKRACSNTSTDCVSRFLGMALYSLELRMALKQVTPQSCYRMLSINPATNTNHSSLMYSVPLSAHGLPIFVFPSTWPEPGRLSCIT